MLNTYKTLIETNGVIMGIFSKITNGKEAMQSIDMDDICFPINEEQRSKLQYD